MLDNITNFAKATLVAGYASGVTTIVASSGEGAEFPTVDFNLVWWNSTDYGDPADDPLKEIVRCTARVTDTFTIVRAQEGTSDNNHNIANKDYKIVLALTKYTYDEIAIQHSSVTVTATYTASDMGNILADASGGSFTVNLPTAVGIAGRVYTIKKIDGGSSNTITINPNGSETIDGESSVEIKNKNASITVISDGSDWFIIRDVNINEVFYGSDSSLSSVTGTTAWQEKLSVSFIPKTAGTYKVEVYCAMRESSPSYDMKCRAQYDNTTTPFEINIEPKDNKSYYPISGMWYQEMTAAAHTIDLDYALERAAKTVYIRDAYIVITKID